MTKEEFTKKWRPYLAGLALYGVASETKDGVLARANRVLEIPAEVEKLLGRLFDDLRPPQTIPANNGTKPAVAGRVGTP